MSKTKNGRKNGKARKVSEKPATGGLIPLKRICADLGIEPKPARVKLRRAWRKEGERNVEFHEKNARWDLTPAQAKEVRAILAG